MGLKCEIMRTIKFRGLDFFTNQWHYGYLIQVEAEGKTYSWIENCGTRMSVFTDSVGKFIGIHDKNAKEVYSGDVTHDGKVVAWEQQACSFLLKWEEGKVHRYSEIRPDYSDGEYFSSHIEIIGNIHQTPTT